MSQKVKRLLIWLLVGVILTCPVYASSSFPDINGYEEFADAVVYVNEAGIMVGDDEGNFNPYKTVTRAEMAAIVCRMLDVDENLEKSAQFDDVPVSHWGAGYISKAAEMGIVNGYGNGKFGPSDNVTYEQAVTMIIRAVGGSDLAENAGGYPDGFIDVAEQHGFLENVSAAKGEPLSRGDIAIILYNCAGFSFLE